jgi:hypothetical protein
LQSLRAKGRRRLAHTGIASRLVSSLTPASPSDARTTSSAFLLRTLFLQDR